MTQHNLNRFIFFLLVGWLTPQWAMGQVTMNVNINDRGPKLNAFQYGIFFEEINHAGEGGLYAEMVRNRSFEGTPEETKAWTAVQGRHAQSSFKLGTSSPLNAAQKHYATVKVNHVDKADGSGIANEGFWGMAARAGEEYRCSFWIRSRKGGISTPLTLRLQTQDGRTVVGSTQKVLRIGRNWQKVEMTLKSGHDAYPCRLVMLFHRSGEYDIDVVSLMPPTFRGRPNGLRRDLAERVAGLHPSFVRFPGGCYVEGVNSLSESFEWKKTIGPIEERPGHYNRNWGYSVTDGLGYDEFLQLCEDLHAAPLFVVNVGLGHEYQIPLDSLDTLVQDALDAIEYANGDTLTRWGKLRARNGHPEPYHLKFIEIGNENYQADARIHSQNYPERYDRFYHAIKERFPDVVTIANVDAWGHDDPVWRNLLPVEIIDEHYYRSYQWMRNNYTKYDRRMRNFQIYNGEYAANAKGTYGRFGNMNSAVGEAIYMLGMERNSDICKMASFAPMFLGDHETRWAYDMIHFNSRGHFVTPSYYIQQMMAMNVGRQNLKWTETGNEIELDSVEGKDVTDRRRVYQAVSIDDEARVIYIKIANPNSVGTTVKLHLREAKATGGSVIRLGGGSGLDENTPENPDHVVPKESSLTTLDELDVPAHSMNIFKISYQ